MNSLELLKAYYKKEKLHFEGNSKEEIAIHNQQSLAPFLYFVYGEPFFDVYLGSVILQEKFYALQKEITEQLNLHQIPHFYIKGSVLSRLYPDVALRTRGDIDVVLQPKDYRTACLLFKDQGYSFIEECEHHITIRKNDLTVEIHHQLFDQTDYFYPFFKDIFEETTLKEAFEYVLTPEIHYVYLVAHLNKHLLIGEGIRELLDFYYLDKTYELNYSWIIEKLKEMKLELLFHSIINAVYEITGEQLYGYTGEPVDSLFSYMLNTGIHAKNNDHLITNYVAGNETSKLKHFLSALFLTDKTKRKKLYPRLSKCFLFYPLLLVHRCFYLVFHKRKSLKQLVTSDIEELRSFYNQYGILSLNYKEE